MMFPARLNVCSRIAVLGVLALFVLSPQYAWSQFTTASLGGTVLDASGAGIPDALVNVLNVQTGFAQDVRTSASGSFLFSRLPIGTYQLRIEKQGFSAVRTGPDRSNRRSGRQPGIDHAQDRSADDEVTVSGTAELVPMRTATGGQLIGEQQIVELPLQGRRPERLMYLAAGTVDLGRNACRICGQGGYIRAKKQPG